MPIFLPTTIKTEIERPQQQNAMLWLFEITLHRGTEVIPPVLLRICDGGSEIEWPLSNPSPQFWQPFGFSFSPIEQTNEGDLTGIDLSIDNSARTLMKFLHDGDGCEGNPVRAFLVPSHGLALAYPNHEAKGPLKGQVAGASADGDVVTFRLSMPNFFSFITPSERYTGRQCRNEFGGPVCGYVINQFAAFTRCSKLISACTARGADMVSRGLPAILPGNFRGYPGISQQRIA